MAPRLSVDASVNANSSQPLLDRDSSIGEVNMASPELTAKKRSELPSCGELERRVGQALQKAYRQSLGHLPSRVTCHLFANKLSVWIENSITPVESILLLRDSSNKDSSVKETQVVGEMQFEIQSEDLQTAVNFDSRSRRVYQMRQTLNKALRPRLSQVIADCLGVDVVALLSDTCYEESCTSIVALLSDTPAVRNPERVPKTAASRSASRRNASAGEIA